MEDFKGTKGKWEIGRTNNAKSEIYMNGNYRAKVFGYGANITDEDVANAQLIAAAPEMLDALQDVVRFCEDNDVNIVLDYAKETIAKALGKEADNE